MNIAYIPVRGGSKSIPLKNIKLIAGKPLVYWAVKAACDCGAVDKVFVCTDSEAIHTTVSSFGFQKVKVIGRSEESSTDTASTEHGMLEFANAHDFTNIALIQATSPLITSSDLDKGFEVLNQKDVDSVISVVCQKRFIWSDYESSYASPQNYDYKHRPRRQEFRGFLVENGAFYITGREALVRSGCRLSGNIKTIEMPPESYTEIDEPNDWIIVEAFLSQREKTKGMSVVKMFLTDCDGTLTDGGMYYSDGGEAMKKFNTRDGVGLRLLKESGIITGIITGEVSDIVRKRAEKLGVNELMMGVHDKVEAILELCVKYNINKHNVVYIGDDLNDVEAIKYAGFGACVGDAVSAVKAVADHVTHAPGGEGAVREVADLILFRGEYVR